MYKTIDAYQRDVAALAALPLPWHALNGAHLLLSGGTGMIGVCLIDTLMARNRLHGADTRVTVLGRNEVAARARLAAHWGGPHLGFVQADITRPLPPLPPADYVLHAASNTHPVAYASDPIGTIAANVSGAASLLEAARAAQARRFLFLSSVEIYGENTGGKERFAEGDLGYIDCNTLRAGYSEGKRLGETLCNAYAAEGGAPFVIARLCRIYGPTMLPTDSKASAQFLRDAVAGRDIVLKSEGKQLFSYAYVTDAVAALLTVLLRGEAGTAYNVADPASDVTLREMAQILCDIAGTRLRFELPPETERRGYSTATRALLDASRLRALGFCPSEDIHSGLEKTVAILREAGSGQAGN